MIFWRCVVAFLVAYVLVMLSMTRVHAENHGFDPADPRTKWMEKQIMPDRPPASCCGKWDAYFVDAYELLPGGTARAHVPAQGNTTYPDGATRPWVDEQIVEVPANKVNPLHDDLDNPFDASVIWLQVKDGIATYTYCFIRHPNGS